MPEYICIECNTVVTDRQLANVRVKTVLCAQCKPLYQACSKCGKRFKKDETSRCNACKTNRSCKRCQNRLVKEVGLYCFECIEIIGSDRTRDYANKRRALIKKSSSESIPLREIINNMPCVYCGARAETIDHIMPISRGGLHVRQNLAAACAKCNMSKNAKLLTEWDSQKVARAALCDNYVRVVLTQLQKVT